MVVDILILIVGFVALIKGADIFVDGSSSLAKHYKISGLIIGLTIVAFGTSAPELAVSTTAALTGSNEIALSNVLGSNLFNLLVVLGGGCIRCKANCRGPWNVRDSYRPYCCCSRNITSRACYICSSST